MENKSLGLWAAVLLLVSGLVLLIPGLYTGLTVLTGGFQWIQVVIGILSVIVALVLFAGDKQAAGEEVKAPASASSREGENAGSSDASNQ